MFSALGCADQTEVAFSGSKDNDFYKLLEKEGIILKHYVSPAAAVRAASRETAVFIVADGYPDEKNDIDPDLLQIVQKKQLKLYLEYSASLPDTDISEEPVNTKLERGGNYKQCFW
jgi:hypothetical protein